MNGGERLRGGLNKSDGSDKGRSWTSSICASTGREGLNAENNFTTLVSYV